MLMNVYSRFIFIFRPKWSLYFESLHFIAKECLFYLCLKHCLLDILSSYLDFNLISTNSKKCTSANASFMFKAKPEIKLFHNLKENLCCLISRYVIECPHHGEIYRSRQFWYGNADPEMKAVRTEIHHVWPNVSLWISHVI